MILLCHFDFLKTKSVSDDNEILLIFTYITMSKSLIMFYWIKTYFYRFNRDNIVSILDKVFKNEDDLTNIEQLENTNTVIRKYGLLFLIKFVI